MTHYVRMPGNTSTISHRCARDRSFAEVTVPYPPDWLVWADDDTTVIVDPREMRQTAEAMMFVDTAVVEVTWDSRD